MLDKGFMRYNVCLKNWRTRLHLWGTQDPNKVNVLFHKELKWKRVINITEVISFLELVGYLTWYLEGLKCFRNVEPVKTKVAAGVTTNRKKLAMLRMCAHSPSMSHATLHGSPYDVCVRPQNKKRSWIRKHDWDWEARRPYPKELGLCEVALWFHQARSAQWASNKASPNKWWRGQIAGTSGSPRRRRWPMAFRAKGPSARRGCVVRRLGALRRACTNAGQPTSPSQKGRTRGCAN